MPTRVYVSVTPELRTFLETCSADKAQELAKSNTIDIDEVYRIVDEHSAGGGPEVKVNEILEGSQVVERVTCEPNLTEIERIRLQSQERAYQRSVQGLAPMREAERKEANANRTGLKFATNFATQVIVAFIGAFLLGYYFVETFISQDDFTTKVLTGAGCSFFTLLLESILFVVHEERSRMIKDKREQLQQRRSKAAHRATSSSASSKAQATEDQLGEQQPKSQDEKKKD